MQAAPSRPGHVSKSTKAGHYLPARLSCPLHSASAHLATRRACRDTFRLPVIASHGGRPMQRRTFMNLTASAAAALAFKPSALAGEPQQKTPVVYPDPAAEVTDPRFAKYRVGNAAVERLYAGTRWAEGPVWFADGRYLLFSDI